MGQMAMGYAGAAVGSYFGPVGSMIGGMIGSVLGGLLFGGSQKGGNSADTKFTASTWGQFIPELYGTARLSGQMIWAGALHKVNPGSKGKGGGGKSKKGGGQSSYVSVSFALAFCKGPNVGYNRIWADGNLVYDATNPSAVVNNPYFTMTFYDGSETQVANGFIADWVSKNVPQAPNAVPAFRGLGYIFFNEMNITPFGNRIPNITVECTRSPGTFIPGTAVVPLIGGGADISGVGTVDWWRGRMYAISGGAGHTDAVIRVVDLTSLQEVGTIGPPGGGAAWDAVTCIPRGGNVYAIATEVLHQIDPDSLKSLATVDTSIIWPGYGPDVYGFNVVLAPGQIQTSKGAADVVFISLGYNVYTIVAGMQIVASTSTGDASTSWSVMTPSLSTEFALFQSKYSQYAVGEFRSNGSMTFYGILQDSTLQTATNVDVVTVYETSGTFGPYVTADSQKILSYEAGSGGVPTGFISDGGPMYDRTDGGLIIAGFISGGSGMTLKFSLQTGGLEWTTPHGFGGSNDGMREAIVESGNFGFWESGAYFLLNTADGSVIQTGVCTTPGIAAPVGPMYYDSFSNSVVTGGTGTGSYIRVYLDRVKAVAYDLASTLQDVCSRGDMDPATVDTTLIDTAFTGYVVTRLSSAKDVIQQLASAFFFDTYESDWTLKFVPRGGAVVATITQDDLAEMSQKGDSGDFWVHTRAQQQDIPLQVNIKFMDQDNAYQENAAYDKRVAAPVASAKGKNKTTLELPVVMNLTTASNIASKWLYTLWTERDSYTSAWGWNLLVLDPSDNVTVNLDNGNSYTVRITSVELGADYSSKITLLGEDMDTYNDVWTAGSTAYNYQKAAVAADAAGTSNINDPNLDIQSIMNTANGYVQVLPGLQFAKLIMPDLPLLEDTDDTGGTGTRQYYMAGAYNPGWLGGGIFKSNDGQSFSDFTYMTAHVTWGSLINILPTPASFFATDTVNTLHIAMINVNTAITSLSNIDFINMAENVAMVGNEIICFQNVAINSDGSYTLSNLLRGVRGTEWACNQHVVGESFILLAPSDVQSLTAPLSMIGVSQYYKLVSLGGNLDTTPALIKAFKGYDLKPWAPVHLARAASGSDLSITWVRRSRFAGSYLGPFTGTTPVAEASEVYDLYIMAIPYDPVANSWLPPVTFVRSELGLTAPTYLYTAAQMATDSFTPSTGTLHIVVFQKSVAIGPGWPGVADLPP